MELRFNIHNSQIEPLIERTGIDCATDLARDGLRLLDWATAQINAGHQIVARGDAGVIDQTAPWLDSICAAQRAREERV